MKSSLSGQVFPNGEMDVVCWDKNVEEQWPVTMRTKEISIHLRYEDAPALKQAIAELEKHHERIKDDD